MTDWVLSCVLHGLIVLGLWVFSAPIEVLTKPIKHKMISVQLSRVKVADEKKVQKKSVRSSSLQKPKKAKIKKIVSSPSRSVKVAKKLTTKPKSKPQPKREKKVVISKKTKKKMSKVDDKKRKQAKRQKVLNQMEKLLSQEEALIEDESKDLVDEAFLQAQQSILDHLQVYWRVPAGANQDQVVTMDVWCDKQGHVIRAQLIHSSGNDAMDRSAKRALRKASPLPLPHRAEIKKLFLHFQINLRSKS
ncbi:MAG TPA: TonB family protein [Gammaproteobacteria bacterium]|nr:TonB family protein [Gammaproteobacteria bacterium]